MSWLKDAFGPKDEPRKHYLRPGETARELFRGTVEDADRLVSEGIEKLMNYALNQHCPTGERTFAYPGTRMVFELQGVVLGKESDPNSEFEGGDFEIEIRRVR